jgi:hypothetical protein
MSSTALFYFLWLSAPVVMTAMAVFMVRRKLREQFPFFFTYAVLQVINVAILFSLYHFSYKLYFYAYWVTTALSIILGLAVIHEMFQYAIRPYSGLRELGTMLFHWAGLLLLLVSGVVAATGPGNSADHVMMGIVNLGRGIRLLQCGLLLFVVLFSSYLGLSLRNFACGIAIGFGIFAATDLTLFSLRAQLGTEWNRTISLITSAAYNISALTWMGYSLLPQTALKRNEVVFQPLFDRWNQAALSVVSGKSAPIEQPAYLTEIEQAVEDILQKGARKAQ